MLGINLLINEKYKKQQLDLYLDLKKRNMDNK